ncbi:MAG: hypothetical protein HZB56_10275 [Deltaproteobacteria bacterium]|nr:hypothetical protein [Deltaproteobacteria bacterium]
MARAPRQPKGPSLDSKWLSDKTSARSFLKKDRSDAQIDALVRAGELGVNLAEVVGYFYPYRNYITGKHGLLKAPEAKVPKDSWIAFSSDREQETEITYAERLHDRVNPHGVRLAHGRSRTRATDVLAPLSAVGAEMLQFTADLGPLLELVTRLRRVLGVDARAKKRLATMRSPRQMFCACVLIWAKRKKLPAPTSGELAALALHLDHEEFERDQVTTADGTHARQRAWDQLKRDVQRGLVPFVEKLLDEPLDDPEDAS